MKILVAGGAGFIGSCCTEILLDNGHDVLIYDSLVKGHRAAVDPRAEFVHGDLRDKDKLVQVMKTGDFDGMIHFAAYIEAGESMEKPGKYFENNVAAGLNLVQAAAETGMPKIVFSSTAATYGTPKSVPIAETAPTAPINAYGESKLMFEKILDWYKQIHGLDYVALRYFNAAGATNAHGEDHHPETHLIPIVLQVASRQRDTIKIFGTDYDTPDGTCIRDYIHVRDLSDAHILALEKPVSGAFNLGSGTGYSVREIIEVARKITGHPIPVEEVERRPGDPDRLISDSTKAKNELGWQPRHDNIHDIVASAWNWRQKFPNGWDDTI
jgi:UDP-glucose 4-epimerase